MWVHVTRCTVLQLERDVLCIRGDDVGAVGHDFYEDDPHHLPLGFAALLPPRVRGQGSVDAAGLCWGKAGASLRSRVLTCRIWSTSSSRMERLNRLMVT